MSTKSGKKQGKIIVCNCFNDLVMLNDYFAKFIECREYDENPFWFIIKDDKGRISFSFNVKYCPKCGKELRNERK